MNAVTLTTSLVSSLAAGALVVAGLTGCGAVQKRFEASVREELARHPTTKEEPLIEAELALRPEAATSELKGILRLAALAPSSHNSQPWQVEVMAEGHLRVGSDPARALPVIDPHHREQLLSVGAFVENLVQAAGAAGWAAELAPPAQAQGSDARIDVALRRAAATKYPVERLKARRTVRDGFASREIDAALLAELVRQSECEVIYLPRGSRHAEQVAAATRLAFEQQTANDAAQRELAAWIRLSNAEARRHRDGITPAMMDIGGVAGWLVRSFDDSDDVLKPDFRARGIEKTASQVKQGAGWMLITSPSETAAELIDTGWRFERLALLVREQGLALHPMPQALEESHWRRDLSKDLGSSDPIQFILRCGFVECYPEPVSLRRPVAWFANDKRRAS